MSELAKKMATYDDLYGIPDNMVGEIIDGELIASPRPPPGHQHATAVLSNIIGPFYDRLGRGGGPGGWVFLYEVEIKLGENILVPDFAGWKAERFPAEVDHNWIPVAPDWICEFLSRFDQGGKSRPHHLETCGNACFEYFSELFARKLIHHRPGVKNPGRMDKSAKIPHPQRLLDKRLRNLGRRGGAGQKFDPRARPCALFSDLFQSFPAPSIQHKPRPLFRQRQRQRPSYSP